MHTTCQTIGYSNKITAEYVRFAEEIADISYSQSETISSVSSCYP